MSRGFLWNGNGAWLRSNERADPEAELCIDIRHLLEVMPLMLANSIS
jgi:hypothetical protein